MKIQPVEMIEKVIRAVSGRAPATDPQLRISSSLGAKVLDESRQG
jgi:hypothetical protein